MAMEIARMLNRCLLGATATICVLRDNFGIPFWCKFLAFLRGFMKWHASTFGDHPSDALNQDRPAHLWRIESPSEQIMVDHQYECSSQKEVPKVELRSVMYGTLKPSGRFEALGWRSPIPPYYNYIYTCEVRDLKTTSAKRKRT